MPIGAFPHPRRQAILDVPDFEHAMRDALFVLPAARLPEALSMVPARELFEVLLPGADPSAVLAARESVRIVCSTALSGDFASVAGLPFVVDGAPDPQAVSDVVCLAIERVAAMRRDASAHAFDGGWTLSLSFATGAAWMAALGRAVDASALAAWAGVLPDVLRPFPAVPPGETLDVASVVGLVDADARSRFVSAVSRAASDPDPASAFRRSYFRRSLMSGLSVAVSSRLLPEGGESGTDFDGWPSWWSASGTDRAEVLARVPSGILSSSVSASLVPSS